MWSTVSKFLHRILCKQNISVGGGTAGCVVASRLSEDPQVTVLLVEAGQPNTNPSLSVPLSWQTLDRTAYEWRFQTQPQHHAAKDTVDQKVVWSSGKILGGSSAVNSMNMMRGSKFDYDLWQDLGNEGWSYNDVLPIFEEIETAGKIPTLTSKETSLAKRFVEAGKSLGYAIDTDSKMQEGFRYAKHNIFQGHRVDTGKAYIDPVSGRPNLHVITDAIVTKVLIQNNTANGVLYYHNKKYHRAQASKEVIVSAGAVMSPFLLMHSGIGPQRHLEAIGIQVVADLPVGQGIEDHVTTYVEISINASESLSPWNTQTVDSLYTYLHNGTGSWSTTGIQGNAFLFSEHQTRDDMFPYIQLSLMAYLPTATSDIAQVFQNMYGLQPQVFDSSNEAGVNREGFTIFATLLHPRSTGTLRLRNKNPFSKPKVTMPYLQHSHDVADLLQGIKLIKRLVETKQFKKLGAVSKSNEHPHCKQHDNDSDEYWKCYIRHRSFSGHHYSSSCKMAPRQSRKRVLDSHLRVKGINQLRVVDASVMPHVVSGSTMLPVVMIAEKASQMIKNDHTSHSGRKTE